MPLNLAASSHIEPYVLLVDAMDCDERVLSAMLHSVADRPLDLVRAPSLLAAAAALKSRAEGCVAALIAVDDARQIGSALIGVRYLDPSLPLTVLSRAAGEEACDLSMRHGAHCYEPRSPPEFGSMYLICRTQRTASRPGFR